MKPSEEIKGNLIGQKGVCCRDDGDPERPGYEDEALPIDIGDAAPYQEKAAKGERVR